VLTLLDVAPSLATFSKLEVLMKAAIIAPRQRSGLDSVPADGRPTRPGCGGCTRWACRGSPRLVAIPKAKDAPVWQEVAAWWWLEQRPAITS
jgi:hypothetical protein